MIAVPPSPVEYRFCPDFLGFYPVPYLFVLARSGQFGSNFGSNLIGVCSVSRFGPEKRNARSGYIRRLPVFLPSGTDGVGNDIQAQAATGILACLILAAAHAVLRHWPKV